MPAPSGRIESPSNARIKRFRALATPKGRRESRRFQLEGVSLIQEALAADVDLTAAYVCPEQFRDERDEALASELAARAETFEVSERVLKALTNTVSPQPFVAEARVPRAALGDIGVGTDGLIVATVDAQDPGNLGTMIRTAHAVGAAGLVALGNTVDPYAPKVVRATMGSLFNVTVVRERDWREFLTWCRASDVTPVAATGAADRSLHDVELPARTAVLLGGETQGLPEELETSGVLGIAIPMPGGAESLNLSVAAGVLMYEYRRQHPARG